MDIHPTVTLSFPAMTVSVQGCGGGGGCPSPPPQNTATSCSMTCKTLLVSQRLVLTCVCPCRVVEEEDGGAPPTSLQDDLGWDASAPDVSAVVVPEGAVLQQAGTISSLLEGMVVVTGLENSRALDMG